MQIQNNSQIKYFADISRPVQNPSPGASFRSALQAAEGGERPLSLQEIKSRYDVRSCTPGEIVTLSKDLFMNNLITGEQYMLLSFQPELSPQYEAIYGNQPDLISGRDYVQIWQDKVEMAEKYQDPLEQIAIKKDILNILRSFAN